MSVDGVSPDDAAAGEAEAGGAFFDDDRRLVEAARGLPDLALALVARLAVTGALSDCAESLSTSASIVGAEDFDAAADLAGDLL